MIAVKAVEVPGVHRLEIPTPFAIGALNAYLLEGPPLTLIDAGPHTEEAQRALRAQIEALGFRPEQVERLLITHPHLDHFGLARWLKEACGCRVYAHPEAVAEMRDFAAHYERERAYFERLMVEMGMPLQTAQLITRLPAGFAVLAPPVEVDQTLQEGDPVPVEVGGSRLEPVDVPGHSPGSLCFHLKGEGALFSGDHILEEITSNPLLQLPDPETGARPKSLLQYIASLEKVDRLDLELILPGHRGAITDPHRVIERTLKHHERRKAKLLDLLDEEEEQTPYILMGKLFSNLPATEQFLGMSEVIGHLEVLEEEGRVRARLRDGVW